MAPIEAVFSISGQGWMATSRTEGGKALTGSMERHSVSNFVRGTRGRASHAYSLDGASMARHSIGSTGNTTGTEVTRFQVEIDPDTAHEMDRLQSLGGLRTKKELLATALTILTWTAREKAFGCDILSASPDGEIRVLASPFLDLVALKAKKEGTPGERRASFRIVKTKPEDTAGASPKRD